jgi:hypothetical protein
MLTQFNTKLNLRLGLRTYLSPSGFQTEMYINFLIAIKQAQ